MASERESHYSWRRDVAGSPYLIQHRCSTDKHDNVAVMAAHVGLGFAA